MNILYAYLTYIKINGKKLEFKYGYLWKLKMDIKIAYFSVFFCIKNMSIICIISFVKNAFILIIFASKT
jgi:hypothetical protein